MATRIIVISSVRPEPTSAGQIILHRHLVNQPGIEWESYGSEPSRLTASSTFRRAMGHLAQTRLQRLARDFWAWRDGRWLDHLLPKAVPAGEQSVVLTVAQGDAFGAAWRFAQKHRLPLVTIFHDWWPDMGLIHPSFHELLEKRFRELYRQSRLALCVSEGMRAVLGPHPNAQLLYPIPAKASPIVPARTPHDGFRVMYHGNLQDYGPMVANALNELKGHRQVRLEVRGGNPRWPEHFRQEMQREGLWHDYAPRAVLNEWMGAANAFLVPMVFEPAMRRRMETSFPSKMLEMAQFVKPLVIWGPEYCSAVQWGRQGNRALCVTDPNPAALRQALEKLAASTDEQQRLAASARQAALTDFNPDKIQTQFMDALQGVLEHGQIRNGRLDARP
jgi:glycosyltransferase involved in cell wall biosynthesis